MSHQSPEDNVLVHEDSYQGNSITAILHRRRLKQIVHLVKNTLSLDNGEIGDFGCSNGFILAELKSKKIITKGWKCYGLDHSEALLKMAASRNLHNTIFASVDLNTLQNEWLNKFDLVTCFETLEHVGSWKTALENLVLACKIGGRIVISVPNEKGAPGIMKYLARKLVRKNPYGDFFEGKSEVEYFKALVLNKRIDVYRDPSASGWGPHLGFDWQIMYQYITETYIERDRLNVLNNHSNALNFSQYFVFEKVG